MSFDPITYAMVKKQNEKPTILINPTQCFETPGDLIAIENIAVLDADQAIATLKRAKERLELRFACLMGMTSDGYVKANVFDFTTSATDGSEFTGVFCMQLEDGQPHLFWARVINIGEQENYPSGWACALTLLS